VPYREKKNREPHLHLKTILEGNCGTAGAKNKIPERGKGMNVLRFEGITPTTWLYVFLVF
jgi:hypothetical protein